MIEIPVEDLPEIEEWEDGKQYKIQMTVTQTSPTEDGSAQFSVEQATGRAANSDFKSRLEKNLNARANPDNTTRGGNYRGQ